MSEPWGHKFTLSVYVEGDRAAAWDVITQLAAVEDQRIAFMGVISIDPVQDEPKDQIAS
jgi:hypothetical protein